MSDIDERPTAKVLRGLVAGTIAGIAASFVMDRFQALASGLMPDEGGKSEPATVQTADAVSRAVAGEEVPKADKPLAGQAVHYALGALLGAAYGVAAEFRPEVTKGYGSGFALSTAGLLDQAAVPALGLGDPIWKASTATTVYGLASHLVFGATTEYVRRKVATSFAP